MPQHRDRPHYSTTLDAEIKASLRALSRVTGESQSSIIEGALSTALRDRLERLSPEERRQVAEQIAA